jgi:pimeloyl-ACP methyl ester carboxylesterase
MANQTSLPARVLTLADLARVESASESHIQPCGDGRLVLRSWGSGAPVVLLHGGSGSWTHWVRNIAALVAAGRQVWIPDLPGFGDSDPPPGGQDADAMPAPLAAALTSLLGSEPVDLVGFSFGGMVAGLLTEQFPERVRRLVLAGAPALGIALPERLALKPWAHLPEGPEREAAHRENLKRLMLANEAAIDALAVSIQSTNLPRDRLRRRRLSRTDILLRALPRIGCPVAGIWGREDALYRGAQNLIAPALAQAPDFRGLSLIPGAGHWVQFEDAPAFDMALAQALAG